MDRLSALTLALALTACGNEAPASQAGRFDTVETVQGDIDQVLTGQCDIAHPAASAPTFTYPPMTGAAPAPNGKWTWLNFWATWCRPCVEELPMLRTELASSSVSLLFVSADSSDQALTDFRAAHAFTDASPRLVDPAALETALSAVGFRGASSLPVHVLIDPRGKARCVRAGAVEARHVRAVLSAIGQQRARRIR